MGHKFCRLSEELDILRIFFSDCVEEDINKDNLERVIFKILLDFEQERTGLSSIIRYLVRNVKNKQSSAILIYLSIILQQHANHNLIFRNQHGTETGKKGLVKRRSDYFENLVL